MQKMSCDVSFSSVMSTELSIIVVIGEWLSTNGHSDYIDLLNYRLMVFSEAKDHLGKSQGIPKRLNVIILIHYVLGPTAKTQLYIYFI